MDSFGVGRTSDPCEQELDSNLPERGVSVFDPSVACVVGVLLALGAKMLIVLEPMVSRPWRVSLGISANEKFSVFFDLL